MKAVGTRGLTDSSQCPTTNDAIRGEKNGRVNFPHSFTQIPKVTIGLNSLDILQTTGSRINISIKSVDTKGFNYSFITWCITSIYGANANWLAVGK